MTGEKIPQIRLWYGFESIHPSIQYSPTSVFDSKADPLITEEERSSEWDSSGSKAHKFLRDSGF